MRATLEGGVELLKLGSEEFVDEGLATSHGLSDLVAGARSLRGAGARRVLISRGVDPAILIENGATPTVIEFASPRFEELDHRGAGDSMFAAIGVGLARGLSVREAARLGMAAGAST